jgi:hypothetical protein
MKAEVLKGGMKGKSGWKRPKTNIEYYLSLLYFYARCVNNKY